MNVSHWTVIGLLFFFLDQQWLLDLKKERKKDSFVWQTVWLILQHWTLKCSSKCVKSGRSGYHVSHSTHPQVLRTVYGSKLLLKFFIWTLSDKEALRLRTFIQATDYWTKVLQVQQCEHLGRSMIYFIKNTSRILIKRANSTIYSLDNKYSIYTNCRIAQ